MSEPFEGKCPTCGQRYHRENESSVAHITALDRELTVWRAKFSSPEIVEARLRELELALSGERANHDCTVADAKATLQKLSRELAEACEASLRHHRAELHWMGVAARAEARIAAARTAAHTSESFAIGMKRMLDALSDPPPAEPFDRDLEGNPVDARDLSMRLPDR